RVWRTGNDQSDIEACSDQSSAFRRTGLRSTDRGQKVGFSTSPRDQCHKGPEVRTSVGSADTHLAHGGGWPSFPVGRTGSLRRLSVQRFQVCLSTSRRSLSCPR